MVGSFVITATYTGLRPGEKLHEELFYEREELLPTPHPKLLQASSFAADLAGIAAGIDALERIVRQGDAPATVSCLRNLVPEFRTATPDTSKGRQPQLRIVQ